MFSYRLATNEDNQQLIELTASTGMAGETALRIDRKPDFFSLLAMRGETKVFVAVDKGTIIGSLCVSLQQVYVGGRVYPLQYIGDFKVAVSYRNKGIGLQLCNELADYVISTGADLAFLNVAKGNTNPISFFKNRSGVPDFENIGIFNIHQFIGKKRKAFHSCYKIESTTVTDELLKFLNTHYRTYQLGSVITKEKLEGTDIYITRQGNKITAAMCVIDTMHIKQNVVMKLSWKMKWQLKVINAFSNLVGISKMPFLNEPVRMLYIKYLAVNNHDKQLVKLLVNRARNIVYEKSYSFVSIGLHEKDPYNSCFPGLFKLTFKSIGMLLSIKNNKALVEKVKQGIPFEDYSLV
ncbi:MAG: GNAT family N-acetyltransferase [Chitinophagaceae bacterium]|nr:GNAT family N-acetyltransferase [Chitinophagaceae bacterium]